MSVPRQYYMVPQTPGSESDMMHIKNVFSQAGFVLTEYEDGRLRVDASPERVGLAYYIIRGLLGGRTWGHFLKSATYFDPNLGHQNITRAYEDEL